jgi:hypothetical protein
VPRNKNKVKFEEVINKKVQEEEKVIGIEGQRGKIGRESRETCSGGKVKPDGCVRKFHVRISAGHTDYPGRDILFFRSSHFLQAHAGLVPRSFNNASFLSIPN